MTELAYEFPYPSRRSPVMARNMVATSQPLAAQAGVRMLLRGGNAVDAALATAIALTVVEPTGNGLGSDAFAIVWDGERLHGLNASGRSPAAWAPDRFAGHDRMPMRGWESVTVPGAVSAWTELSERFGRLPFAVLFEPALDYAHNGFHVSPVIAVQWARGAEMLSEQPGFREAFMPNGRVPKAGELFVSRHIGGSLEAIAQSQGKALYEGELAERIVRFAERHGAALSRRDLRDHRPYWSGTISTEFRGAALHEIPPNGQGIAALMALGILEQTDIDSLRPDSAESLHLQVEAMKLAFADMHRFVCDHDFMDVSAEQLLSPDYLARRAKLIDRDRAGVPQAGAPKDGGTVYVTTADADGMMVSFIQSNYSGFGAGVVVPETGISLQNRGSGFTLEPGHPNRVGPSKRPFHTIIPGFLMRDGAPVMSFGVMGGPMQAQGHVQMVLRTQVWGQNPQTASDAPRWRVIEGRKIAVESAMDDATVRGLEKRGHAVTREEPEAAFGFGGAQLIHRIAGGYAAGSDHRKDGAAVGF